MYYRSSENFVQHFLFRKDSHSRERIQRSRKQTQRNRKRTQRNRKWIRNVTKTWFQAARQQLERLPKRQTQVIGSVSGGGGTSGSGHSTTMTSVVANSTSSNNNATNVANPSGTSSTSSQSYMFLLPRYVRITSRFIRDRIYINTNKEIEYSWRNDSYLCLCFYTHVYTIHMYDSLSHERAKLHVMVSAMVAKSYILKPFHRNTILLSIKYSLSISSPFNSMYVYCIRCKKKNTFFLLKKYKDQSSCWARICSLLKNWARIDP